jgi:hypothetical protein
VRQYPVIDIPKVPLLTPISFVVVKYCDEYYHNILNSQAVQSPRNQLVTVDNHWGHRFDSLSAAINEGLDKTVHDLVAIVHEDVLLPDGWQHRFQRSLDALETEDPNWGMLGSVGWDAERRIHGHWSDPQVYQDTLSGRAFVEVARLDEHLMVIRKSSGFRFDDMLPSIHNIGRDAASALARVGRRTYAIDAPTIHKYADEKGRLICSAQDSAKIQNRFLPANLAEWHCSNAYLVKKWPEWEADCRLPSEDPGKTMALDRADPPVIALARGGSGSRLLSLLLLDLGIFMGYGLTRDGSVRPPRFTPSPLLPSGDADMMRDAVYRAFLAYFQRRAPWQRDEAILRLRTAANAMLRQSDTAITSWGFKLPESLLILPQLDHAFPGARYIHLIRDPLSTCLRRTHMTARFDNVIGRTAIRTAYAHCGRTASDSLSDPPPLHMAYTTRHQIETARTYAATHLQGRYTEVRFEDILAKPQTTRQQVANWLGVDVVADVLTQVVDPERVVASKAIYDTETAVRTAEALQGLRAALGYR